MGNNAKKGVAFAVAAAALYALNAPVSKLLLGTLPPLMMAGLLYLGAGIGMLAVAFFRRLGKGTDKPKEQPLTRKELPFAVGMVLLDVAAPVLLMLGLTQTTAANASLLNNFEIVATSLVALLVFKEAVKRRLWLAIGLITLSSIILSTEDISSFAFSGGSLLVLAACVCWGFENNCTRMMSQKDPQEIVIIKGFASGGISLVLALLAGEWAPVALPLLGALLLGFVAYGLSIFFYVYAQRWLGAAKTSAYYALAPFIGVGLSFVFFRDVPGAAFFAAFAIMAVGVYFASTSARKNQEKST